LRKETCNLSYPRVRCTPHLVIFTLRLLMCTTGWPRCMGCLIFARHFSSKSPIMSGSFATHWQIYLLQCVAVCCSVLQCVAVCCSVLQHTRQLHTTWSFTPYLLQCAAVCCRVLQCVAVCYSTHCSFTQLGASHKGPYLKILLTLPGILRYEHPLGDGGVNIIVGFGAGSMHTFKDTYMQRHKQRRSFRDKGTYSHAHSRMHVHKDTYTDAHSAMYVHKNTFKDAHSASLRGCRHDLHTCVWHAR